MINETTIEDLNDRLSDCQVSAHNFRPNIIVKSEPYAEDEWKWVKIGDAIFRLIKPATRCVLTTVDPETGIKNEKGEPLKTLRKLVQFENDFFFEKNKAIKNRCVLGIIFWKTLSYGKWKSSHLLWE